MIPTLIAAAVAAAAAGGGMSAAASSRKQQKKQNEPYMKFQERKNQLIDDLLGSLDGKGKFGYLFGQDEAAFQKSFVDPAKQMFKSQITPQIQQGSIAGGMQRSSSLDDNLMRAGVDLDQVLNQSYMSFQNQGKDRAGNMISSIFGASAQQPMSTGPTSAESGAGAASGFAQSDAFKNLIKEFSKSGKSSSNSDSSTQDVPDGVMGQIQDYMKNKGQNPSYGNQSYSRPGFKGVK